MRGYEIIVAVVVLVAIVAAIRWQYGRAMDEVTSPDRVGFEFPATTPIVRQLCPSGGSDCLILPTPDINY